MRGLRGMRSIKPSSGIPAAIAARAGSVSAVKFPTAMGVALLVAPIIALAASASDLAPTHHPAAQSQAEPARRPGRGAPPPPPVPPPADTTPAAPGTTPADPNAPAAPAQPNPTQPASSQPSASPTPDAAKVAPPKRGPIVQRSQQKDWILTSRITVFSDNSRQTNPVRDPRTGRTTNAPRITPFAFQTLSMVYPMVLSTAGSDLMLDEYKGVLKVDDRAMDNAVTVLKGYPAGLQLGRWDAVERPADMTAREVSLEVEAATSCFRLQYDERAANAITWPTAWPEEAQSTFAPQLWIDSGLDDNGRVTAYDPATLDAAITAYLREEGLRSPKDVPPARLAKILAAKVWRDVQPSGQGLSFRSGTGQLSGFTVQAPHITLENKRGSAHDTPALLCALYRRAGLPARVVIGMDTRNSDQGFLKDGGKGKGLRTWVEFYLFDERANTYNWVPVDIVELRKSSSRPQKLDQTWRFFGAGDFESLVPIALHFHPPTDVVAYGNAGLWGWFVTPAAPQQAEQVLEFAVRSRAVRGGERPRPRN